MSAQLLRHELGWRVAVGVRLIVADPDAGIADDLERAVGRSWLIVHAITAAEALRALRTAGADVLIVEYDIEVGGGPAVAAARPTRGAKTAASSLPLPGTIRRGVVSTPSIPAGFPCRLATHLPVSQTH